MSNPSLRSTPALSSGENIGQTGQRLPTGTVTFLFTDIEGSTKMSQEHSEEMPALLKRHNEILTQSIQTYGGHVFRNIGDSYSAAFSSAANAVNAALRGSSFSMVKPGTRAR